MGFGSVDELEDALLGEAYLPQRGLSTALYLSLVIGKPLLLEGEAGVGKTELAKSLARASGARLIRLQCYEGLDVVARRLRVELRAPAPAHPRRAGGHRRRGGAVRARVPHPPPAAGGDRVRRAGRAAHRRDRPRGRRVRGLPPGGPLRLPDHDPGDRDDHREAPARGHPHVEPHARAARRPQAALPVPLDHAPVARARDRDRPPERSWRAGAPRGGHRGVRRRPARRSTWPRRRASRRRSTGRRRSSRSAARSSTRPSSSRRSAPSSSTTRTSRCCATRRCSRCSARRAPRPLARAVSEALTRHIVTFGRVLREAGMEVGPGRVSDALRGLDHLDITSPGGRLLGAAHDVRGAAGGPRDVRPRLRRLVPAPRRAASRRRARPTRARMHKSARRIRRDPQMGREAAPAEGEPDSHRAQRRTRSCARRTSPR